MERAEELRLSRHRRRSTMLRSILPVARIFKPHQRLISQLLRPTQARCRPHAFQQSWDHRTLGGMHQRLEIPVIVHTIHGNLAFTASTSQRRQQPIRSPRAARAAPDDDANRLRRRCDARPIARRRHRHAPQQYMTVYSGDGDRAFTIRRRLAKDRFAALLSLRDEHVAVGHDRAAVRPEGPRRSCSISRLHLCDQLSQPALSLDRRRPAAPERSRRRRIAEMGFDNFIFDSGWSRIPRAFPNWPMRWTFSCIPRGREGAARTRSCRRTALRRCKPTIAYDIDGNREGFIDGQTWFYRPAGIR